MFVAKNGRFYKKDRRGKCTFVSNRVYENALRKQLRMLTRGGNGLTHYSLKYQPRTTHVQMNPSGLPLPIANPVQTVPLASNNMPQYFSNSQRLLADIERNVHNEYIHSNVTQYKNTHDWETYQLIPGQRLMTGNAFGHIGGVFGLTHHAVYVGNGWILEVGPTTEDKSERQFPMVVLGFSPLRKWLNTTNPVFLVNKKDRNLNDKENMVNMFQRAREVITDNASKIAYGVTFQNCESFANYIAFDDNTSYQGKIVNHTFIVSLLTYTGTYFKNIKKAKTKQKCSTKHITEDNGVCTASFLPSIRMWFGMTCDVDPNTAKKHLRKHKKGPNGMRYGVIRKTQNMTLVPSKDGTLVWNRCG